MKMMIGFLAGFAAGAVVYSKLTEQQRAEVAGKLDALLHKGRTGDVVQSVTNGVGNVADVATDRVTDTAESVTTAVADKLAGSDGSDSGNRA